jgi:hypothetical protein
MQLLPYFYFYRVIAGRNNCMLLLINMTIILVLLIYMIEVHINF